VKKSRYSDEQIMRILRGADKDTVPELPKRYGVSGRTIYSWCKRYSSGNHSADTFNARLTVRSFTTRRMAFSLPFLHVAS